MSEASPTDTTAQPEKPASAPPKRRIPRLVQAALGLLVGLGLAETAFNLRDGGAFPHINCYLPDPALGVRLRPGATERISFGGNPITQVRINSAGYRGPDWSPPSGEDILVIGDSQVFGLGVEENETFSSKLQQEMGGSAHVLNVGVPTWGPPEYLRALEELLPARKPKTVVYVINFVNDPFEAARPNTERHAVWDGWAVRKETAPASISDFPGRQLLFQKSHAVFALRQWLYRQGPERDDRGFASEGTWKDLIGLGDEHETSATYAKNETERRAQLYRSRVRYAARAALAAELHVKLLAYETLKLDGESNSVYLSSHANPGDIVVPQMGEEGRPLAASVEYIQQAADMRKRFEERLKKRAGEEPASAEGKEIARSIEERDALEKRLVSVLSEPTELVRAANPLLRSIEESKLKVEAAGARFVLLVLPIDVQVSADEWKKYGHEPMDLGQGAALINDLVEGTRALGASALDATLALREAEPGAFLKGDPHMSPRGHESVAKALAAALKEPPPKRALRPLLALPSGRSRLPRPEEWHTQAGDVLVHGSDAAHCTTRRIREWLYVRCTRDGRSSPIPLAVRVEQGGHGEVMSWTADETLTLVAPTVRGDHFEATFYWNDRAKRLVVDWPKEAVVPTMGFQKAEGSAPQSGDQPSLRAACACLEHATPKRSCGEMVGSPDEDCLKTYGEDCDKLLTCLSGWPIRLPHCDGERVNAGAALHCFATCDEQACPTASACVEKQGAKLCVPEAAAKGSTFGVPEGEAAGAALEVDKPLSTPSDAEIAAFDTASTKALSAIQKALESCRLAYDEPGDWFVFEFYDTCAWKEGAVPAASESVAALEELVKKQPALEQGKRADFMTELRLFRDWLELSARSKQSRGTLALFQDLARSFNTYQKDASLHLPLDPPHIIHQYTEDFGDAHVNYISRSYGSFKRRKERGLPLVWLRGVHGPRLQD